MAERKLMDNTAYRRRRAVIGEASDIEFRGGLPIGSDNFTVASQAVAGFPEIKLSANAAVPMNSSNGAASRQSGLYRSNATPYRIQGDSPAPRSDGMRFNIRK